MSKGTFRLAVSAFHMLDDTVLSRLPAGARQAAFGAAYWAKGRLFPAYKRSDLAIAEKPRILRRVPRSSGARKLPEWLSAEIMDLRRTVDPGLYRTGMPTAGLYQAAWPLDREPARALRQMQAISPSPRYVVIAPWVKRGGADLLILKHLRRFASLGPTCLITTEPVPSEWLHMVPEGVDVIGAGDLLAPLAHPVDRRLVLARYLMQSGAATVHLINSRLGWETFRDYGRAISQDACLFASLYMDDDVYPDGTFFGYAHEFLPSCSGILSGIISDNGRYLGRLAGMYGIDPARTHLVYASTEHAEATPPVGGGRVLWAGRLVPEKRPDILRDVARACPQFSFDVYGAVPPGQDRALSELAALPNVRMMGAYDGFGTIGTGGYGAFLYTSERDGLPNVLVEAGMRGMCVVATAIGGIPEIIGERTGWPVAAESGWEGHAAALRQALEGPDQAQARAAALRELVMDRHTHEAFAASLGRIPRYL